MLEIPDTAICSSDLEMFAAVFPARPADRIAVRGEGVGLFRFQAKAQPAFDFRRHPLDALVVDRVFEAGMAAVDPVAKVALDAHYRIAYLQDLVLRHEADDACQPRIGLRDRQT